MDNAFSKQSVPKIPLQAPNAGPVSNFVAWRDGRDQIHDTLLGELVLLVQNGTIKLHSLLWPDPIQHRGKGSGTWP